jgi:putative transposase
LRARPCAIVIAGRWQTQNWGGHRSQPAQTTVQTCIVQLIRASLRYVPRRQFDAVTKDLKPIYTAINPDQAMLALEQFETKWGQQLPIVPRMWREAWQHVIPFMAFEPEVRRVIYTTNAVEALNRQLRKAIKTKGSFPSEDAARS